MSKTVFLSMVTGELGPLRLRLARVLQRTGRVHVRHQGDFVERGVLTLEKLEEEIKGSDLILHVIGKERGSIPPVEQVDALLDRLVDFDGRFPNVAQSARDGNVTYTQWEAWLALYFDRRIACYLAEEQTPQTKHIALLREHEVYAKSPEEGSNVFDELIATLVELGYLNKTQAYKPIELPFRSLGTLFKGREESLNQLHASLNGRDGVSATAIVGTAVHGLGGIGKTRLAVEYAWQHADDYTALLLVTADSPQALHANLAAFCGPTVLNLPEQDVREENVRVGAVLRWLQKNDGWLLILDNIDTDEAATEAESFLAKLSAGNVVLTSRRSDWSGQVKSLPLEVLSPDDAASFLLQRTADNRRTGNDDQDQAHQVAKELGYLALALEQAGAYICQRKMTFTQYRQAWEEQHDKVIKWYDAQTMQYPASVAVTWQTTIEQLNDGAAELLRTLAWFAPEPIPESILEVADDGDKTSSSDRLDALVELDRWSLVSRPTDSDTFSVHRLVQDVTRRQCDGDDHAALRRSLRWINAAFFLYPGDVRNWPTLDPLSPHVRLTASFADEREIPEPTSTLLGQLGSLANAKALYSEAESTRRRALEIDEQEHGVDSTQAAHRMSDLAQTLQDTNRLAEAEPLMRRALAIDEGSFGESHPRVAIELSNLAQLLQATDRRAEAEPLIRRALAIDEASYGETHPDVAIDLNNLATLLKETNRLAEAEPLMRRALAIDEGSFGESHPRVAIELSNLAQLLQATERRAEAEPRMRRAVTVFVASLGGDHPNSQGVAENYRILLEEIGLSKEEIAEKLRLDDLPD